MKIKIATVRQHALMMGSNPAGMSKEMLVDAPKHSVLGPGIAGFRKY